MANRTRNYMKLLLPPTAENHKKADYRITEFIAEAAEVCDVPENLTGSERMFRDWQREFSIQQDRYHGNGTWKRVSRVFGFSEISGMPSKQRFPEFLKCVERLYLCGDLVEAYSQATDSLGLQSATRSVIESYIRADLKFMINTVGRCLTLEQGSAELGTVKLKTSSKAEDSQFPVKVYKWFPGDNDTLTAITDLAEDYVWKLQHPHLQRQAAEDNGDGDDHDEDDDAEEEEEEQTGGTGAGPSNCATLSSQVPHASAAAAAAGQTATRVLAQSTVKALAASIADIPNLSAAQADTVLSMFEQTVLQTGAHERYLSERLVGAGCLSKLLHNLSSLLKTAQSQRTAAPPFPVNQVCIFIAKLCSATSMSLFGEHSWRTDWNILTQLLQLAMTIDSSQGMTEAAEDILQALMRSSGAAWQLCHKLQYDSQLLEQVLSYQHGRLMHVVASTSAGASQMITHYTLLREFIDRQEKGLLATIADNASLWGFSRDEINSLTSAAVLPALIQNHSCCGSLLLRLTEEEEGVRQICQMKQLTAVVAVAVKLAADPAPQDYWRGINMLSGLVEHSKEAVVYLLEHHMAVITKQLQQWEETSRASGFLKRLLGHSEAAEAVLNVRSMQSLCKQLKDLLSLPPSAGTADKLRDFVSPFSQLLGHEPAAVQFLQEGEAADGVSVKSLLEFLPSQEEQATYCYYWFTDEPVLCILRSLMKCETGFKAVANKDVIQILLDYVLQSPPGNECLVIYWELLNALVQDEAVADLMLGAVREQISAALQGRAADKYKDEWGKRIVRVVDKRHQQQLAEEQKRLAKEQKQLALDQRKQRYLQREQEREKQRQEKAEARAQRAAKRAKHDD